MSIPATTLPKPPSGDSINPLRTNESAITSFPENSIVHVSVPPPASGISSTDTTPK